MGLDMYLNGRKHRRYSAPDVLEDGFILRELILEIGYWRKHPDLHGYIVQTFADGVDECQEIHLGREALKKIMLAVKKETDLPKTEGFFFGESTPDRKEETLEILQKALTWIESEKEDDTHYRSVIYRASW